MVVAARLQVHVLQPGPGADREGHQGAGARPAWWWRPARRTCTRTTFRDGLRQRRAEPLPVRAGLHPRAGLLGAHRQGRRHREGQGHALRRRRARQPPRAARAAAGPDPPGHAGRRRRHRRHPGGPGDRRRRLSRSTWSSASRPSAGTWPSSTRPSPPWTARPASSRRKMVSVGTHPNITLLPGARWRRWTATSATSPSPCARRRATSTKTCAPAAASARKSARRR